MAYESNSFSGSRGFSGNVNFNGVSGNGSSLGSSSFNPYYGNFSSTNAFSNSSSVDWASVANTVNNLINTGSNLAAGYVNQSFNKEQFEYQKDLQERLINLQLNAMQNKVKDYTAAGFSPLAALEGTAGNQVGVVANTAHYADVGSFLANAGAALASGTRDSQRLALDKEIAADSTRLQSLSISTQEYIAEMQNNTALKSIYNSNKQFYDNLSFVFEQNRLRLEHEIKLEHDRLDSAESIKKMEIASNELIASSERALRKSLAEMQDERAADQIMKQYEIACKQLYQAIQEAKKQRDWQSAENAWNRLTSFGTTILNDATQLLGGFINPLGQAFAGNKGFKPMGDLFGAGQQLFK